MTSKSDKTPTEILSEKIAAALLSRIVVKHR
ncbi:hypothetical protein LCGC14_2949560, partial [marine sediment metagenome]